MPRIDIAAVPVISTTGYPAPYRHVVDGRLKQRLGDAGALTQFGVNLTRLKPGAASALRHWHETEDEFVFVLEGVVILIEDAGETLLRAGEAAAFPAGAPNGHQLVNRSAADAVFLEVGTRTKEDRVTYVDSGVELQAVNDGSGWRYLRKSGEPW
ncbi:MAG: cupin domain-containing protein [Parvularculaceae bacterium]|nr:cupin domain-containing protein [Parvularculaceae bacterium]